MWFQRNVEQSCQPIPPDSAVLSLLTTCRLTEAGALLDVGGGSGRTAAGFMNVYPGWMAMVVEPSGKAIDAGRRTFPQLSFTQRSMTEPMPLPEGREGYDVVICSAVLHWCDRSLLSRTIANVDTALLDGGFLVIKDFDAPFPRANAYTHREGLWTYKQDYVACFTALGIYHVERRLSRDEGSASNPADPYDRRWATTVLRKDLRGRYARF